MIRASFPTPLWRLVTPTRHATITKCSSPSYWYHDRVGQRVVIEFVDRDGYWSREGGLYNCINVIRPEDAVLEPLPCN